MSFGIIAGSGPLPLYLASALRARDERVVVAAHRDESDVAIEGCADRVEWIALGELGRVLQLFREEGVSRATMAGAIARQRIFERLKPDAVGFELLRSLAQSSDDTVLRSIARLFEAQGIEIVDAADYLPTLRLASGLVVGAELSAVQRRDITLGLRVLQTLGEHDLGQSIVVKEGSVWAIEAAEGTDAAIGRGASLGGPGVVVVKRAKPKQDTRFDAPVIGPTTIETMAEAKAALLAFDAQNGLVFDAPRVIALAKQSDVAIYGLAAEELEQCALP
ncbi:MAG: UDP-2,3-diacylglucosamine diphosphatase LpxI [Myxococcales bacterium]|nr:UDP-2,3-diacylglucosamine diphosphatase LpxI [Myxococcales bacterium]